MENYVHGTAMYLAFPNQKEKFQQKEILISPKKKIQISKKNVYARNITVVGKNFSS